MSLRSLAICMLFCTALIPRIAHADVYQSVRIIAPKPETTVHDNNGNIAVTVAVSPPLRAGAGDRLTLLLDGKSVASGTALSYELKDIVRGSHTLRVRVKAADGTALATSPPVKFHMWRASRLFPDRAK
jgi:hypothetical protein